MVRRIIAATGTGGVLALSLLLAPAASAQNAAATQSLNPITSGLWAGANFDLTGLDRPASPRPEPVQTGSYAALGDSVAAGAGLPATSPTDDPRCGRSAEAYPYQVAEAAGLPLQHIACSGATAGDLFTAQRLEGPNLPAQLDTAFAGGVPKVVTITAGANDVRWADFLRKCLGGTCGTPTDRALFDAAVSVMSAKYYYALSEIKARSGSTPPKVVLTGYYTPVSAACAAVNPQLSPSELAWVASAASQVNGAIRQTAAGFSFASFAPVDFTGHDICSLNPWVQGLDDPAPLHPNAAGQTAIAQAVTRTLGY